MKKPIGKLGTTLIILATVILAGVAIFTAFRLYQLRQQPVAPNVPSSLPKAEGAPVGGTCGFDERVGRNITCAPGLVCDTSAPSLGGGMGVCRVPQKSSCSLSFTITEAPAPTPGLTCTSKIAWQDDAKNLPSNYYLTTRIAPGSNVTPGQKFVYSLGYKNTGNAVINSASFTDTLPSQVSFLDADKGCTYDSSTRTVTCTLGNVAVGGMSQKAVRVRVSSSAVAGSFTNKAVLQASSVANSDCQISLNIQSSESTPTPAPDVTPTASATPAPTATGTSVPNIASPTPTPEAALPESGTGWPTLVGIGFGILIIFGSILLAL